MQPEGIPSTDTHAPWSDFPALSSEAWVERIRKDLKGADFEQLIWHTFDGIAIKPFYNADDSAQRQPLLHHRTDNTWLIRQDVDVRDVGTAKHQIHEALKGGANSLGLHVRQPDIEAELIQSLLEEVTLDAVAIHLENEATPHKMLAALLYCAEERGVSQAQLRGTLVCNPLKAFVEQGRDEPSMRFDDAAALLRVLQSTPALRALSVDARLFHNAGATISQELGCTLAAASEYLFQMTERAIPVADIVARMRFEVSVGTSFFAEIAKLRALRLLFPQLVRAFDESFVPQPVFIRADTSWWSLTLYDPHSNLLRATTEATAAIFGGCDELSVLPFDAAMSQSNDHARRLALNIQHLLQHEAHLDVVIDPAAGSYYVETFTHDLADAAWSFFQEIEAHGGLISAMKAGFIQQAIKESRTQRFARVDGGQTALVGTNTYPRTGETHWDDVGDHSEAPFATEPPPIEPLPSIRAAAHFEALRLRTERHARTTGRRPSVLPLLLGDPVMANARASFSRNFFRTAGFEMLTEQVHETPEQAARAALEARPDIVVLCSADETYTDIAAPIGQKLLQSKHPPLLVVAGYPADAIDTLRNAGVDAFIHRKKPLLDALIDFQNRLGISK